MSKEMLINVSEGEECRIALVEGGRLEELYMERTSATSHVGNIYKGRVTNVEASIQAAFIDFGLGRNGFLHISDLMPTYFGRRGEDVQESVGRKMARRDRPPIQRCLRRGDDIVVQIIKEGIGTKGPTLSTYLSIPGRILVMMPGMSKLGVSRKIEDEEERRRLRQILDALKPPRDCGFIIRTAGVGKTKADIQKDLSYLTRLWQNIEKKIASGPGPMELYTEGDLVTRTVRDVFTGDIDRIVVDNKDVARRIKDFMKIAMPRTRNRLELYEGTVPLFHKYGIEKEIELMYSRHVPLPSGGSLVIDSTEAIVAIDVNSGKFRDHADAEMTAFKTDLEAADEIPRQLRLRDLGGVIICDFIDLRYERHRRELEKRLHENLKHDRAKTKMLRMSQFGIIEMTRQRMRPSLKRSIYFDCPHCKGAGLVKTPESMALDVMRRLAIAANDARVGRIELAICPEVAFYLQNRKRSAIGALETHWNKRIVIRSDPALGADMVNLELYDSRDGLVFLEELGMVPPSATVPAGGREQGRDQREGRRGRHDQQRHRHDRRDRGRDQRPQQPAAREIESEEMDERFDIDSVEEAVEEREVEQFGGDQSLEVAAASEAAVPPAPVRRPGMPAVSEREALPAEDRAEPGTTRSGRSRRGRRGRGRGRGREAEQQRAQSAAAAPPEPPRAEPVDAAASEPMDGDVEAAPEPMPEQAAAPAETAPDRVEPSQPVAEETPRRGRSRRSRSAGRRKPPAAEASTPPVEQPAAKPMPLPAPEPAGAGVASAVVRTGSTDRHLIRDEPIMPPPIQRPRTYRDLDHIPDDLD